MCALTAMSINSKEFFPPTWENADEPKIETLRKINILLNIKKYFP
jgi:hypothetical protein